MNGWDKRVGRGRGRRGGTAANCVLGSGCADHPWHRVLFHIPLLTLSGFLFFPTPPPPSLALPFFFLSIYRGVFHPFIPHSLSSLAGQAEGPDAGLLGVWASGSGGLPAPERERERERERGQGNAAQFVVFFSQMAPLLCGWSPHCALMLYLSRFGSPSPLFPLHSFHVLSSSFSLFTLLIPLFL